LADLENRFSVLTAKVDELAVTPLPVYGPEERKTNRKKKREPKAPSNMGGQGERSASPTVGGQGGRSAPPTEGDQRGAFRPSQRER